MSSLYQIISQLPLLPSFLLPTPLTTTIGTIGTISNEYTPSSSNIKPPLCPNPPSLSCPSSPPQDDINTCCVNHPSGHFLQTQFWDTAPPIGPNNSWTIHGLWPDLCTGGFEAFCDSSRSHSDIRAVLRHALEEDHEEDSAQSHHGTHSEMIDGLLSFMETYWLSLDGDHEHLWAHEWNKHGTCISTLEPYCYSSPSTSRHRHLDVLDYFIHATSLFKTLDTYTVLADAGILPSSHKRYSLQDLETAVQASPHGHPVTFRCNHRGELDEVWYHFAVMGSLRQSHTSYTRPRRTSAGAGAGAGSEIETPPMSIPEEPYGSPFLNTSTVRKHFVPVPPDGALSNCPRRGIKYLPKSPEPPPSPTKTTTVGRNPTSAPTSTSAPFTGRGHLEIHILPDSTSNAAPAEDPLLAPSPISLSDSASLKKGCLIRQGQWYISGTCATFRAQHDVVDPGHQSLFSLSSSYSPCLVNPASQKFECTNSAKVQGIFSYTPNESGVNVLAYHNRTIFYAHSVPKRFEKVDLFADDGNGDRQVQVEIHWIPA
ncbi:uncharacterized protein Z520_01601 [Fonsecaea multimorphosa CBS 102226]|uniref:Ribonuclease T2-like n=1 Tax=Fonsecaea multimorphosa CBS 102226 TaxID=1442371 RepID=A0A0D2L235_9EURO|nr:uncharacterized protein Z520_01601 [Fonsecaea multimorphosa CBS 102226]KIY03134.1 hypothetical protein Z520_01601 [Fonsecaea multimorphosa CBS 102226]OAL30379.1 hypothetical protein AYO22_01577 [Fonsecaea multimorphosa]